MDVFLLLGIVGLVVLLAALVFGDWLDGLLPDIELGDGLFSLPVIAGFVAAFGFAGAAIQSVSNSAGVAVLVGGAAGCGVAWLTLRLTQGLMHMRTDEPVRSADLIGRQGHVITPIRAGQLGEVLVVHAGQSHKLAARAEHALLRGEEIVVIEVLTPTSVLVSPAAQFWAREEVQE